ncbi:TetR-like C-terminal domain-containing protein [Patulibacter americanus]|uniref:TetR-like C-terminal domain-containing protein n=1 Tax=Patulibacter americanus TaxID=588672 RepID=UPI0003B37685|nr:TetR-like C-terminal domain-containing protein [Patulibacter americanus]
MAERIKGRVTLDAGRVVDAAVAVADADGFDAVSLSGVAAALGVRTPSLYHHVDGLGGLRRGIALRGIEGLGTALRDATIGRSGADALTAFADAYRDYAARHPGSYAAAQRTDLVDDGELHAAVDRGLQVLRAVVRPWEEDEERQVHLVRTVRSALHGFVMLEAGHGFGMPASRDESFALLVRLQVAALDAYAAAGGA